MRKLIAVLLTFVLSFSCLSVSASAKEVTYLNISEAMIASQIEDGWTFRGASTHEITWTEGLIAAGGVYVIAELISAAYPVLKASHIYSAGGNILALIAGATTGGTLEVEFYTYTAPYQATQEMYIWKFTPWTGSPVIGPVTFINPNVISSVEEEHESK